MSGGESNSSKVPPLYSGHSARHDWLYNKPTLKTRTQPRFDAASYLDRQEPVPTFSKKQPWIIRLFRKNPRRFTIVTTSVTLFTFYNGFIFDIFIFPAYDLMCQAREAFLPASLEDFKKIVSKNFAGAIADIGKKEQVLEDEKVPEKK
ncbi:hypothetical protein FHG87_013299 [Trinorchestia longiramus]|nr:hypothetical protein FHG87_013299 [Trinorchestia longiramus]